MASSWWVPFLNTAQDLRTISYPGIGIFAILNQVGDTDIFQKIDRLLKASPDGLWQTLGSFSTIEEKAALAPALQRKPEWGSEYDIQFPEVPPVSNFPNSYSGVITLPLTVAIQPGTAQHSRYFIPRDEIIEIVPEGEAYGRVRIMRGDESSILDQVLMPGQPIKICRGTNCGCESGDPAYDVIQIEDESPSLQLYMASFSDAITQVQFSRGNPRCCEGSRNLDPRFIGTWSLDLEALGRASIPPAAMGRDPIILPSGEHLVTIDRTGMIHRRGKVKMIHEWLDHRGNRLTHIQKATSSARACFESKENNPNLGMFKQHGLIEGGYTHTIGRRNGRTISEQSAPEEWQWIRWGTGRPGVTGAYQFFGSDLHIRGESRIYKRY